MTPETPAIDCLNLEMTFGVTRALAGQTSFLENQRIFIDRNGYLEEPFFTFSFTSK